MIFKTALATLLTASLAGGVVYYGTQDDGFGNGEVALESHPHKTVKVTDDEENVEPAAAEPTDKVIDKLLNRNSDETTTTTTTETTIVETVETNEMLEDGEPEELTQLESKDVEPDPVIDWEVEAPIRSIDNGYEDLARPELEKSYLVDMVFEQAKMIEKPELRDQAYLNVVTFALKNNMYGATDRALIKIDQVEMRDTARSQIAISLAKGGDIKAAFKMIDDVETESLRDIMRLQVIEAMITPERLPANLTQD